jgi:hypothetical protein
MARETLPASVGHPEITRHLAQHDVERLVRDVLMTYDLRVSMLRVEHGPDGWRIMITDIANRVVSTAIADGPPARVRPALTSWVLNQS